MTEVPVTDWANYEGDLPERYPHRQPLLGSRYRRTSAIPGPDRAAYIREKRRRLKARSPTLTVTKVEPSNQPSLNTLTFENGVKAGHPKSKNAKIGDKFVVASQDGRFAHIMDAEEDSATDWANYAVATYKTWLEYDLEELDIDWNRVETIWCKYGTLHIKMEGGKVIKVDSSTEAEYDYKWPVQIQLLDDNKRVVSSQGGSSVPFIMDAEEGNAPIQDPMEFGEMANWTPLDGSEGLKRKRAEAIQVENVMAGEDTQMIYVSTYEAAVEEAERFIRHYFPADYTYSYHIHETDQPNRWEMVYGWVPQGEEAFLHDVVKASESPSATIPVKGSEPAWVKPVATALGFALGFFGIHEIKKVL